VKKQGLVRRDTRRFNRQNLTGGSSSGGSDHNMDKKPTTTPGSSNPLMEKRPSITAEELTPIVLSQLQTTSKLKEETRKLRRGSRSSNSSTPASTVPDTTVLNPSRQSSNGHQSIIDSGSESCGEEARIRTAEAFMSGIQSAIHSTNTSTADGQPPQGATSLSEELVGEVDSVLSKLMQSINRNDPSLMPLIVNLQASLKATVKPVDSNRKTEAELDMEKQAKATVAPLPIKREVALSEFSTGSDDPFYTLDANGDLPSTSKIPWKIRAARKRAMKHHTTGMTKDEFAKIKQSLMQSSANCKAFSHFIVKFPAFFNFF
jgi:hypothetical protein